MLVCVPKQVKPQRPLAFQLHKWQATVLFCKECFCLLNASITARRSFLEETYLLFLIPAEENVRNVNQQDDS